MNDKWNCIRLLKYTAIEKIEHYVHVMKYIIIYVLIF